MVHVTMALLVEGCSYNSERTVATGDGCGTVGQIHSYPVNTSPVLPARGEVLRKLGGQRFQRAATNIAKPFKRLKGGMELK